MPAVSMSTKSILPRFLLPQSGLIWRGAGVGAPRSSRLLIARYASTTGKSSANSKSNKQKTLEKPARFNPPSHGARLPRKGSTPRHYGGELSEQEVKAQGRKDYPGLMAPKGTKAYWFWNSRRFHLTVTMGTLAGLAVFTYYMNFKENSPFLDLLPDRSEFLSHPVASLNQFLEVVGLTEEYRHAKMMETRKRMADDAAKRAEYRKAHGLDDPHGYFGLTAKMKTDDEMTRRAPPPEATDAGDGKRQKWFGIF